MKKTLIALSTATAVAVSSLAIPAAGAQTGATAFTPSAERVAQVDTLAQKFADYGLSEKFVEALKRELAEDYRDSEADWAEDIREVEAVLTRLADPAARKAYVDASLNAFERDGSLDDDFIDPSDFNRITGVKTENTDPAPQQPKPEPSQPGASTDREAALDGVIAKFKELGLADGYITALERELRDDIRDRDNDFEKELAQADAFAEALKADKAKLDFFMPVAAKVGARTELDDDMYDVYELKLAMDRKLNADAAYRELQDADLSDRIEDRIKAGSSDSDASSKLDQDDDKFDGVEDILEIIAAILGILGIVGVGAAVAKNFDLF